MVRFEISATRIFSRTSCGLVVVPTARTARSFGAYACDMTKTETYRTAMRGFSIEAYCESNVGFENMRRCGWSGEYKFHSL